MDINIYLKAISKEENILRKLELIKLFSDIIYEQNIENIEDYFNFLK